jgi:signal peptidase I
MIFEEAMQTYFICNNSMSPILKRGDAVVIRKSSKIPKNSLVVFDENGRKIVRRVKDNNRLSRPRILGIIDCIFHAV